MPHGKRHLAIPAHHGWTQQADVPRSSLLYPLARPILTDLAFYHKLTLQLLTHLHHLLVGGCDVHDGRRGPCCL